MSGPSHDVDAPPDALALDRPPTRWGDREQRRVDILDAARTRIEGEGYLSLNMRTLAADAGISPATLYSYFSTKEELFATLYAEAIRAYTADFADVVEAEPDLTTFLTQLVDRYVELYRAYGRHFALWSTIRRDPETSPTVDRAVLVELRSATVDHNRVQMAAFAEAAERSGRRLRDPDLAPSLLWSFLAGIADHLTSERGDLDRYPSERFEAGAVDALVHALTDPI